MVKVGTMSSIPDKWRRRPACGWSLDILLHEEGAIPKGLYRSAQGCEQRATLGAGAPKTPTL
jgi:hypothetical protein